MRALSEGEQNRLILENMDLIEPLAAKWRGAKGIPFDDLLAAGREGLVSAARRGHPRGPFMAYASAAIQNAIRDFVASWKPHEPVEAEEFERDFFEWQIWPFGAPLETWNMLAASPEDLQIAFQDLQSRNSELIRGMIGMSRRDRQIMHARFFRSPRMAIDAIAREHKISYRRVVFLLRRSLEALREIVENIEKRGAA